MKKFLTCFAVVAVAVATAVSCNNKTEPTPEQKPDEKPAEVALTGIAIDPAADFELQVGATKALTVKYTPENATNKPAATWASSAPAVATVANGTVTAVAAGEANITATVGEFTATVKVTVKAGEPEPQPQGEWDYTPGADYDTEDNLWAPLDPDDVMIFHYLTSGEPNPQNPAEDAWDGVNTIESFDECDIIALTLLPSPPGRTQ